MTTPDQTEQDYQEAFEYFNIIRKDWWGPSLPERYSAQSSSKCKDFENFIAFAGDDDDDLAMRTEIKPEGLQLLRPSYSQNGAAVEASKRRGAYY